MPTTPADLLADIVDSLISTNEIGDGRLDYRRDGDDLIVNVYDTNTILDGIPIPDATYRIRVEVAKLW